MSLVLILDMDGDAVSFCLFYGSNTNHCKDDLTGVNPADHAYVPRYPCRSFCVQVKLSRIITVCMCCFFSFPIN